MTEYVDQVKRLHHWKKHYEGQKWTIEGRPFDDDGNAGEGWKIKRVGTGRVREFDELTQMMDVLEGLAKDEDNEPSQSAYPLNAPLTT